MTRIRRILHPTDFSRASAAAFKRAVELAKASRAELLLVHVVAPIVPLVGDAYVSPRFYDEIDSAAKASAKKELAARLGKARKAGARARSLLLEGVPHEQITRTARSKKADMIVMGTHGRSGLAKFFLGSVAGRVVATAHAPVLTVRGK